MVVCMVCVVCGWMCLCRCVGLRVCVWVCGCGWYVGGWTSVSVIMRVCGVCVCSWV